MRRKQKSRYLLKARRLRKSYLSYKIKNAPSIPQLQKWLETEPACDWCEQKPILPHWSIDHRQPISRGGPIDKKENTRIICRSCNLMKGDLNEEEFRMLLDFIQETEATGYPEMARSIGRRLKAAGFMFRGRGKK